MLTYNTQTYTNRQAQILNGSIVLSGCISLRHKWTGMLCQSRPLWTYQSSVWITLEWSNLLKAFMPFWLDCLITFVVHHSSGRKRVQLCSTAQELDMVTPQKLTRYYPKTDVLKYAFAPRTIPELNDLPEAVVGSKSIDSFRNAIRHQLFGQSSSFQSAHVCPHQQRCTGSDMHPIILTDSDTDRNLTMFQPLHTIMDSCTSDWSTSSYIVLLCHLLVMFFCTCHNMLYFLLHISPNQQCIRQFPMQ